MYVEVRRCNLTALLGLLKSHNPYGAFLPSPNMKRIQFAFDGLVDQIIAGKKTASATELNDIHRDVNEFDQAIFLNEIYEVYDSLHRVRAKIRIIGMEMCRWDSIPERLWKGEGNINADEFRQDHISYFNNPSNDFEFAAYYFERIG